MKLTFSLVRSLSPCYSEGRLATLLPADDTPVEVTLDRLLALPPSDARWLVSRLLPVPQRVDWAKACAERAKGYAAAARAAHAAAHADADADADADAAADAAAAAAHAAADADADADAAADAAAAAAHATADEHRLAMEHAIRLL